MTRKSSKYSKTSNAKAIEIKLQEPHTGGQRAIYTHPARFQIVSCGRRFGKTSLGKILSARSMIRDKGHVAWISPTTKMAGAVWKEFLDQFSPIADWVSVQEKTIILKNGGKFTLWTAENPDAIRGQAFSLAIMDEAAMYKSSEIWHAIIRPALSDEQGGAYFLSTPRGRNWFWELYQLGLSDVNYQSWSFPSSASPFFLKEEFAEARKNLPERFFKQEYLAEFLIDGGEVFQGAAEVSILPYIQEGHEFEGEIVFGIDFGRSNDLTVISVLDAEKRTQLDLIPLTTMSYPEQERAIWEAYERWKPVCVMAERNSAGLPVIEHLQDAGMDVEPFFTSNSSKQDIIDQLSLDIQNKEIWLLNDREQLNQLQAYTMNRTKTGKISYSAPAGYHDDYVMALAIANHACHVSSGSFGCSVPVL